MRKKLLWRVLAGMTAAILPLAELPVSYAAYEDEVAMEAEETGELYDAGYTVKKDPQGQKIDLGGAKITIRAWWEQNLDWDQSDYGKARKNYVDWAQKTYNFTIEQPGKDEWGASWSNLQDYNGKGGDDNYYLFVVDENSIAGVIDDQLAYDISSLKRVDWTQSKYFRTPTFAKTSGSNGQNFAFSADYGELRTGMYVNKSILADAGISMDDIYDLQANGQWTWAEWIKIMDKIQRDTDGDGETDVWGFVGHPNRIAYAAAISNGTSLITKQNGVLANGLKQQPMLDAMDFYANTMLKYMCPVASDSAWDLYKGLFVQNKAAFVIEDEYIGQSGGFLEYGPDVQSEYGFVALPKGTSATANYAGTGDNVYVIPSCYDSDKAEKIALAYDIFTEEIPGYENYNAANVYRLQGKQDARAISETVPLMEKNPMPAIEFVTFQFDPNISFYWNVDPRFWNPAELNTIISTASAEVDQAIADAQGREITFTTQPDNATVKDKTTVTLKAEVAQKNYSYQWFTRKAGTTGWVEVPNGATTQITYTVQSKAEDDGREFRCRMSGMNRVFFSRNAKLTYAKPALEKPNLSGSVNGNQIVLNWEEVSEATGYKVYRKTGSDAYKKIATVTDFAYTDKTGEFGKQYTYKVVAYDAERTSTSNEIQVSIVMSAPYSLEVKKSGVNVLLNWGITCGVDGYYIYRKEAGGSYKRVGIVNGYSNLKYTDTTVMSDRSYTYMVRAFSGTKQSGNSPEKTIKLGSLTDSKIAVPTFAVKGVINGRNMTFNSTVKNARIYYSSKTSALTEKDKYVAPGTTVLFNRFYGTIYAKTYVNGKWSNPARFILKIPVINKPTITNNGNGYYTLKTTTPSCSLIYTTDGTTPSVTNGKKINASVSKVYIGKGKTIKVIAIRSCFTNSDVATLK